MAQNEIEHSLWIAAPQERIWQAITDPEQFAQWFLPPALGAQMKRDDHGTLYVCMYGMEVPVAVIETMDQPQHIGMRSLPDRLVATNYTLREEKDGTRISLALSGFESLPANSQQDRVGPSTAGIEKALKNLKAFVDGTELPFPQGYVAAIFGYRREASQTYAVERSIWIDAPRERVWQAITDPSEYPHWFSPGTPWQMSAFQVGGRFYVRDEETGTEKYTQIIEVLDPPNRFAMRTVPETPDTPHDSTAYTLVDEKGGTRLTVLNSGFALVTDDIRHQSMEQNAFGFGMMLLNVKAYVEGQSLPYPQGF